MKAVILAGGEGTRLRPLTCTIPKPMVPVLNRPFLEYMLEHLRRHGIDEVVLALYYLPEQVQRHFGDGSAFGIKLHYSIEEHPLGTAGAVKQVEALLDDTFFVFNGDIFTDLDLTAALSFHRQAGAAATIVLTPVEDPSPFGAVETDSASRVQRFVEKPSPEQVTTCWVNAGTYILEPRVLRHVPTGAHYMFERGLFPRLLELREAVWAYRCRAYWLDLGTPRNYLKAHRDLLLGALPIKLNGSQAGTTLWVGEGSVLDPTAQVSGPVLVGRDCVVGPQVRIQGPAALGNGCRLGQGSVVEGSVLWAGARVGPGAVLRECILGRNVRVGEGVTVGRGCILADDAVVEEGNHLEYGAALGPGKRLAAGTLSFVRIE
ncbi:MAG: NDP-sugar synthase [Chloroflexi bacterium]|nr:NDP-sugar synthase [Chloroflexota bacterium]